MARAAEQNALESAQRHEVALYKRPVWGNVAGEKTSQFKMEL